MHGRIWPWLLTGAAFAADRVTKALALRIPPEGTVLIPGVLGLRYAENRGIAFSMLSGAPWLLGLLSLAVVAAAFLWLRKKTLPPVRTAGLMLMLGGAAGNMIDRLFRGYVVDMVDVLFVNFAVFNLADACLCVGCALAVGSLLFNGENGG